MAERRTPIVQAEEPERENRESLGTLDNNINDVCCVTVRVVHRVGAPRNQPASGRSTVETVPRRRG